MKTINLILPYEFKDNFVDLDVLRDGRRSVSESLITAAVSAIYPKGLSYKEAKLFQTLTEAFRLRSDTVSLEKAEFDFLHNLFLGKEADEKVKFAPAASAWVVQWVDHLEALRLAE